MVAAEVKKVIPLEARAAVAVEVQGQQVPLAVEDLVVTPLYKVQRKVLLWQVVVEVVGITLQP